MTTRALRSCPGSPLCPELVPAGEYCEKHRSEREARRPSSHARGYDEAWRATRTAYLDTLRSRDPEGLARCEECGKPETPDEPLEVDHLDGLGPTGPRGHHFDNLQALCRPHHQAKTAIQTGTAGGPR